MKRHIILWAACLVLCATAPVTAALNPEEELGRKLYFDTAFSLNGNQSCSSCHNPAAGFADPRKRPVSEGSVTGKFGDRNAPSAAYAAFAPFFHWDSGLGLYIGGQFWDGRAGTLANQAGGPPLNPVEMAMADKTAIVFTLFLDPSYRQLFGHVYNNFDLTCAVQTFPGIDAAFDLMTKAIAAFKVRLLFAGNGQSDGPGTQWTRPLQWSGKMLRLPRERSGHGAGRDFATASPFYRLHLRQSRLAQEHEHSLI